MSKNSYLDPELKKLIEGIDNCSMENLEKKKNRFKQMEPFEPGLIITALLKLCNIRQENVINVQIHLSTMIVFGLVRGFDGKKTWASIYNNINDCFERNKLQTAVDFLSVKIGRPNRKDTLTVPRLMQSYPTLTWGIHCNLFISGRYVEKAEKAGYNGGLPLCLRYSGSPGVMGPDVWDTYRNEYFSFALAMGRFCKSGQSSEEIIMFGILSYECLAIEPDERISMAMVKKAEAEIEEANKYREGVEAEIEKDVAEMMEKNYFYNEEFISNLIQALNKREEMELGKNLQCSYYFNCFCKFAFGSV